MDGHRFDEIARLVASGTSRRRVLGLVAGGLASIGLHFGRQDAAAGGCIVEDGECNNDNLVCCDGLICGKDNLCHADCAAPGELCGVTPQGELNVECCPGAACIDGVCITDEPVCVPTGEACLVDTAGLLSCCDKGAECIDGICQFPEPTCIELGESCDVNTRGAFACCDEGAECIDGICQIPEPVCSEEGESCGQLTGGIDCCGDLVCVDGTCEVIEDTCVEEGDSCEVDSDCCDGICCVGFCRNIECCIDEPNPNDRCPKGTSCFEGICEGVAEICEGDDDCGAGTCCCEDGSCSEDCCEPEPPQEEEEEPVVELPNTGSGTGDSSRTGWLGAAAIGAAAAFLGGKSLRPAERVVETDTNE